MADVDTEIVGLFLETEGYFVRLSVRYDPAKPLADIDVLAVNPKTEDKIWGEVKGWIESKEKWPKSWDKYIVEAFTNTKEQYVQSILGNNFRKVCYLPLSRASQRLEKTLKERGIEIFDLSEVARKLKEKSKNASFSIT
ncbi:MAG: hypothetical protein K6T73_10295, partial [Candidatus Bathyarchaeota archaeon]|nr:hypothetical protein [Candidatus Bathyarchaeota archaeon]